MEKRLSYYKNNLFYIFNIGEKENMEIPSKELIEQIKNKEVVCAECGKPFTENEWYSVEVENEVKVIVRHESCYEKYLDSCSSFDSFKTEK